LTLGCYLFVIQVQTTDQHLFYSLYGHALLEPGVWSVLGGCVQEEGSFLVVVSWFYWLEGGSSSAVELKFRPDSIAVGPPRFMTRLFLILRCEKVKNFRFELSPSHEADLRQDILFIGQRVMFTLLTSLGAGPPFEIGLSLGLLLFELNFVLFELPLKTEIGEDW